MKTIRLMLIGLFALAGCETASYRLVEPGVQTIGSLRITAGPEWNLAPAMSTPASRSMSQTWTQDGLLLDRLVIIPSVGDGESLFVSRDKAAALPVFHADMLPNEIEELVESSIVKLYGEGNAAVSTSNLRPQGFGTHGGFMFDIEASVTESPDYRGMVGAFIDDEKLNLALFLAAEPAYYEKHAAEAESVIRSMTTSEPTIGRY